MARVGARGGAMRLLCLLMSVCVGLASIPGLARAEGAGVVLTASQVPSMDECMTSFEKFLLTINVAAQMTNPDLLSCVGGAGESCCRAIDEFIGQDSPIWGCSCHKELHTDAWDKVFELAPIVSPGSNLAYIPVARPIVMRRIEECGIPTPANGGCPDLSEVAEAEAGEASVGVPPSVDPAVTHQGATIVIPRFNQSAAQVEYSAPYERVLEGFDEYGWFTQCRELGESKYCLASLQAPANYMQVRYGLCVSEATSESALARAITDTSPEHYDKHPPRVDCGVMDKTPLDKSGLAVMGTFLSLLGLVVLGTAFKLAHARKCTSLPLRVLECFDLCANWKVLMSKPLAGKHIDLRTLNGLRTVSMFWVILGHTLTYIIWIGGIAFPGRLITTNNINMVVKKWYISLYSGAFFAVDTFFFLSGLLVAFLVSREIEKRRSGRGGVLQEASFWVVYVVNRFLRLLPVFAAVLLFFWKVAPSLASSPWWQQNWDQHSSDCAKYWWTDLFFLNNFIPVGNQSDGLAPTTCVGGSWYLAVDTQLYLFVAPVIIIAWHHGFYSPALFRWRKALAVAISVAMIVISIALSAYTTVKRDVWLQYFGEGNFYFYYIKPWIRAPPYVLGILLGLNLHYLTSEEKGRRQLDRLKENVHGCVHLASFLAGLAILCALVFPIASYYDTDSELPPIATTSTAGWSWPATVAYNTLKFSAWGLALLLIIFPSVLGKVPLATELLGGHIWGPFAKLTYGAYLIHMLYPQALLTASDNSSMYYHTASTLGMWMIFTLGSYFWAAVLFFIVEAPFSGLQKLAMGYLRGSPGAIRAGDVKRKLTDAPHGCKVMDDSPAVIIVQDEGGAYKRSPRKPGAEEPASSSRMMQLSHRSGAGSPREGNMQSMTVQPCMSRGAL